MASNAKPVVRNWIEYNSNNLEGSDDEEKEPIDIEFTEQKTDLDSYENAIDFRWSDVQGEDEEHIAKANFIERNFFLNLKKKFILNK